MVVSPGAGISPSADLRRPLTVASDVTVFVAVGVIVGVCVAVAVGGTGVLVGVAVGDGRVRPRCGWRTGVFVHVAVGGTGVFVHVALAVRRHRRVRPRRGRVRHVAASGVRRRVRGYSSAPACSSACARAFVGTGVFVRRVRGRVRRHRRVRRRVRGRIRRHRRVRRRVRVGRMLVRWRIGRRLFVWRRAARWRSTARCGPGSCFRCRPASGRACGTEHPKCWTPPGQRAQ